jgi:D-alanyl-D-alanine carboxypeptidase (penicillin-binding protein 5/6)
VTRRGAVLCALLLCVALLLAAGAPATAAAQDGPRPPDVSGADAAIVIDARDGTVLFEKAPDERRSIASTTKLMTALLVLERAEPDDVYAAPPYDALAVESQIGLETGERMRVDDLLEALLLESANDAAATLADGIAGSEAAFVQQMNARARDLGLEDTSYANPIGLDEQGNHSTARDLATLARRLLQNETFAEIVDSPQATLESGATPRVVENRNGLVAANDFVDGVKTGFTSEAGHVLVGAGSGRLGAEVISVVMGEPSEAARDEDTLELLRNGLAQFRRVQPLDADSPIASAAIAHQDGRARLVPVRDALLVARRDERIRTRVEAPDEVEGELAAGTRVGRVSIVRDGRVVRRVPLVTAARVPAASPFEVLADELGTIALVLLAFLLGGGGWLLLTRTRNRRRDSERAKRRRSSERARAKAEL